MKCSNKIAKILNLPQNEFIRFDLKPSDLFRLRELGYINLEQRQNDSPSIKEFMDFVLDNFLCDFSCHFEAYLVPDFREDARLSIEGIVIDLKQVPVQAAENFYKQFIKADEYETSENNLRAWWD